MCMHNRESVEGNLTPMPWQSRSAVFEYVRERSGIYISVKAVRGHGYVRKRICFLLFAR